jgi:Ca-activated chloride channel family protein
MIEFEWLWALVFLPLPLVVYFVFKPARHQESALHVPFFKVAAGFETTDQATAGRSIFRRSMLITIWCLLVLASLRPEWIGDPVKLPTSGRDLMLAVDISGSMGTEDMEVNSGMTTRLRIVKAVVGDFVERRVGDRLGLILFGSQAYLQTPLTFDRTTVRTLLAETPLGIAGGKTAIGDAIGLAVKRLQSRPENSRILILLTDGKNNVGEVSPIQAAKIAATEGVKIYTIGFGADELVIPGLLFNRTINPSAELDTKTLTEIANITGGIYQRARNLQELASIYDVLDALEPIEQDQQTYRPEKSLFFWPLGIALICSMIMALTHPLTRSFFQWMVRQIKNERSVAAQS